VADYGVLTDDELLRLTSDDREAFGEFYGRHVRGVIGELRRRGLATDDVQQRLHEAEAEPTCGTPGMNDPTGLLWSPRMSLVDSLVNPLGVCEQFDPISVGIDDLDADENTVVLPFGLGHVGLAQALARRANIGRGRRAESRNCSCAEARAARCPR